MHFSLNPNIDVCSYFRYSKEELAINSIDTFLRSICFYCYPVHKPFFWKINYITHLCPLTFKKPLFRGSFFLLTVDPPFVSIFANKDDHYLNCLSKGLPTFHIIFLLSLPWTVPIGQSPQAGF